MTIDEALRLIAGVFILLSVLLAVAVSPYFLLFTGFVGLNLAQSSFTRWCPMMVLLRRIGLQDCSTGRARG